MLSNNADTFNAVLIHQSLGIQRSVAQRQGKNEQNTNQHRRKSKAICRMVKSQGAFSFSQTGTRRQTNCYQQDPWWTSNSTSDLYLKWRLECHPRRKKKKERKKEKSRHREVVIGNCSWQLFVQAPDFFHLYANPASPHWKTGQVPLMSNLFQSSRVWAWQFTERLEELVITSVTGQLMHITLRHSWRWLSAPQ